MWVSGTIFLMNMRYELESQIRFIGEKRNEPYEQYGEESIGVENRIWAQEGISGKSLVYLSERPGS